MVLSFTQCVLASKVGDPLGCLVTALTRSQVLPVGSMTLGDVATKRGMGMYTMRLFCKQRRRKGGGGQYIYEERQGERRRWQPYREVLRDFREIKEKGTGLQYNEDRSDDASDNPGNAPQGRQRILCIRPWLRAPHFERAACSTARRRRWQART
jgi:hypothetical protein